MCNTNLDTKANFFSGSAAALARSIARVFSNRAARNARLSALARDARIENASRTRAQ
jgi:hypothetical protein